ncbi:Vesicle transport protein GOT1A [Nosema granulosis]|uniref:Vesicle transport protein GOT1A n=1 Tax=Nosema granulosis TaxID=83296 RepID=A0A9P6KZY0_9MICR|nr:Vesicle transport protein GOT1A [Nosema granulosis]
MLTLKESGVIVISIGFSFFLFGFILFFDRAIMIGGNLLILIGITILARARIFDIFQPSKLQGACLLLMGVVLLFYRFAVLGFLLEASGLFLIFKDNIPTLRSIIRGMLFGRVLRKTK